MSTENLVILFVRWRTNRGPSYEIETKAWNRRKFPLKCSAHFHFFQILFCSTFSFGYPLFHTHSLVLISDPCKNEGKYQISQKTNWSARRIRTKHVWPIHWPRAIFKRWLYNRYDLHYKVLHQNLPVCCFILNLFTIFKDIKLKIGTDDLQFLNHDIVKVKNNDLQ